MADESWESALKLVQEGNPREAHALFEKIVSSDVHNISAWFWYAKTSASGAERTRILQNCLRFNPDSEETREFLGLAPAPQSESAAASQQHAANSLTFRAPGSPAPEADSGESTKPVKAYVPTPPPAAPAATAKQGGNLKWVLLVLAVILLAFLAMVGWAIYRSIPRASLNPADYRHTGAVEYYLYSPKTYTADREWRLFVGIHGSGGTGLDCWNW